MSPVGAPAAQPGQINGRVIDAAGAAIPGVTVMVDAAGQRQTVVTDVNGSYVVSNLPNGTVTVTGQLPGFTTSRRAVQFDQRGQQVDLMLPVGGLQETVTVVGESQTINAYTAAVNSLGINARAQQAAKARADEPPSVNVQNLQRRASGVLPVRMEVPRAGTSHRFVKPLVIDEETSVTFRYKRR